MKARKKTNGSFVSECMVVRNFNMGAISDKTLGSGCLILHLMLEKQSKFAEQ